MLGLGPVHSAYVVSDALFWLALPLAAWLLARDRASRWPVAALSAGTLHHLAGWIPFEALLRRLPAGGSDIVGALRRCALLRPLATHFYEHSVMCDVEGWRLIPYLPKYPTYMFLASVDSLAVVGLLLAVPPAVRWSALRPARTVISTAAAPAAVIGLLHLAVQVQALRPWGSILPLELELGLLVFAPVALLAPAGALLALLALPARRWRRTALLFLACALASGAILLGAASAASMARRRAIDAAVLRWQPLVEALDAAHAESGSLPPTLAALVPRHLPAVPSTGFGAHPDFLYEPRETRWPLTVPVPDGRIALSGLTWRPPFSAVPAVNEGRRIGAWTHTP